MLNSNDQKKIDKMAEVIFGDKTTGEKGLVEKVDEIYNMFVKINNGISLIAWFFGAVIVLGLFVGTIKGWAIALLRGLLKN